MDAAARSAFITGKLAQSVCDTLGRGVVLLPDAVLWAGAEAMIRAREYRTLAVIELSASGYRAIGIDQAGKLVDDLLVGNPRCGAGSGINLDRVLQKLAVPHSQVDVLLGELLGEAGREHREAVPVRADRSGVFSVSAIISDKNQGIPLRTALAVTLKSEVLKACKQVPAGFEGAILTGGVFRWRYARDCARDYLAAQGVETIEYDDLDNPEDLTASFSVGVLERFEQLQGIDPERDILYLATCGDNRALSAIARAAGVACVDHFDEKNYDLEESVRAGRDRIGDAVCSPLAAMYGDLQRAVADLERKRAVDDPLIRGKQRRNRSVSQMFWASRDRRAPSRLSKKALFAELGLGDPRGD